MCVSGGEGLVALRYMCFCFQFLVALVGASAASANQPAVFREIGGLAELTDELNESDRVLVSFSVPWCMGCIRMDRDVWNDSTIAKRLESLDASVRPKEEFLDDYRSRYGVHGFPELILFEGGEEIGRLRGFWGVDRVIAWLDDPTLRTEPGDPQTLPIGEVHDRAVDLLLEQRWGEAAEFLSAFWVRSAHDEAMTDTLRWMRASRYPSMLRRVAQAEAGRTVIEGLYGSLPTDGPGLESDMRLMHDWLVLSLVLDRTDRVDMWIDRMFAHERGREVLSAHGEVIERLIEREMFEGAGAILSETVWGRWVARAKGLVTGDPVHDAAPDRVIQNEARLAPERLRRYIRALRAAGRDREADDLELVL